MSGYVPSQNATIDEMVKLFVDDANPTIKRLATELETLKDQYDELLTTVKDYLVVSIEANDDLEINLNEHNDSQT